MNFDFSKCQIATIIMLENDSSFYYRLDGQLLTGFQESDIILLEDLDYRLQIRQRMLLVNEAARTMEIVFQCTLLNPSTPTTSA